MTLLIFKKSKNYLYIASILIALGVTFINVMRDTYAQPIGFIFIAIGGFLFIVGMKLKKDEDSKEN